MLQVRQNMIKNIVALITHLEALVPKGRKEVANWAKTKDAAVHAFVGLCQNVAVELTYVAALGNAQVRIVRGWVDYV